MLARLSNSLALALCAAGLASAASSSQNGMQMKRLQKRQAASTGLVLTGPGPGEVFKAGGTCTVTWTADTSGASTWKSFTLDLNTGSNQAMTKLETIATGLDGTNPNAASYSWTCPEVAPYSAIYFYQATTDGTTDPQWTTRFTIASPDGKVTPPPHDNQPGGGSPAIPWGTGRLVSAPATNSGSSGSGSAASGSGASTSSSTTSSTGSSADTSSSGTGSAAAAVAADTSSTTSSSSAAAVSVPSSVATTSSSQAATTLKGAASAAANARPAAALLAAVGIAAALAL